jgi:predicted HTH transcriptional regulator
MFGTPIESIDFSQILSFLQTGIREGFALDFKENFPSSLEKTLASFANSYGGMILIGVAETDSGAAVIPIKGVELTTGLRERVLQKGLEAVYPPVLPEVHVVEFKSDKDLPKPDRAVVVIRVAESEDAPHAVEDRTVVYFRNDNISSRFLRKATVGDIEWLVNKRQRSIEEKGRLVRKALERTQHLRSKRRNGKPPRVYPREGGMTLFTVPCSREYPFRYSQLV